MEKITLDYPVKEKGRAIETLSMRRPKVVDMINSDKQHGSELEKEARLFANLCEVMLDTIQALDMKDYQKLQQAYTSFLS